MDRRKRRVSEQPKGNSDAPEKSLRKAERLYVLMNLQSRDEVRGGKENRKKGSSTST